MSEITESEIFHMSKKENYFRGYSDGKEDALDKIKALSEELKICQKSIKDKKALIGFNMAVALINKHLAKNEEEAEK